MNVKLLSPDAILPKRASGYAAGYDLFSPISGTIEARGRLLIPLDIAIELPEYTFGHILPRSGLAVKHGIQVGAGVVDEDYRGNLGVLLFNFSDVPFVFNKGDRIAQMVIKPYIHCPVIKKDSLNETERGQSGFGSTGK